MKLFYKRLPTLLLSLFLGIGLTVSALYTLTSAATRPATSHSAVTAEQKNINNLPIHSSMKVAPKIQGEGRLFR